MTERADADRLLMADAVQSELKQFEKLRKIDPPITCAQIAERMAWTKQQTRWLLRKMKDHRK